MASKKQLLWVSAATGPRPLPDGLSGRQHSHSSPSWDSRRKPVSLATECPTGSGSAESGQHKGATASITVHLVDSVAAASGAGGQAGHWPCRSFHSTCWGSGCRPRGPRLGQDHVQEGLRSGNWTPDNSQLTPPQTRSALALAGPRCWNVDVGGAEFLSRALGKMKVLVLTRVRRDSGGTRSVPREWEGKG